MHTTKCTVTKVEMVINPDLERAFEAKRREFAAAGLPVQDILAYHGSSDESYDTIIHRNFDIKRLSAGSG